MTPLLLERLADPPLDPAPHEARELLVRELARPEYHQRDLLDQILDWVDRLLDGVNPSSTPSPVSTFVAVLAFLLLALALAWLVSRARTSVRAARDRGAVLLGDRVTAAELRARAEQALAEGRTGDAVVDGFRALAVRQVETGWLEDRPGATAREVAAELGATRPERREQVTAGAGLFDAVLYGHRRPTPQQAAEILALDDTLAGRS